ncbi:MAG: ATP-binding cassette domain-containing protein [Candidatus Kryptonium sp.]|nr:ATP-binding cassette domain-containing protein [Candidatus Kryptonium sp.]
MKKEIKVFLFSVLLILTFITTIFYLQQRLKHEVIELNKKLRSEGVSNYKTLSELNSENLSKVWRIYSREIVIKNLKLKDIIFEKEENVQRRRRTINQKIAENKLQPISILHFLGIVAYGIVQDMKMIIPALLISVSFAGFLPLIIISDLRFSSFVPSAITYIPPFLVIVLLFYFASSSKLAIILSFGILCSTRLGIQLSNSVRSLENDDYVIYMILGGNSRPSVTFKYTYFELLDSIIWGSLWTFYTLFSLKMAMDSLSLNAEFQVNTGSILMGIFAELPNKHSIVQFTILVLSVATLLAISFYFANNSVNLYKAVVGIRKHGNKKISRKSNLNILLNISQNSEITPDNFTKIIVKNLKIYPKQQEDEAILNVEDPIEINLGDKIFVKGPSGSGKTLLTNSIVGILWEKKLTYEGQIIYQFGGTNIDILDNIKQRSRILKLNLLEFVPQNPKHGFNSYATVKEQIEDFGLITTFQELLKEYFPNLFHKIMRSINLAPSKINDGALQIINFVLTTAHMRGKTGVILFDEPIASLSKENILRVYEMLKNNIWDDKHTVIWIGHELETLEQLKFNKLISIQEKDNRMVAEVCNLDESFVGDYRKKINELVYILDEMIDRQSKTSRKNGKNILYDINVRKISFKQHEIIPSSQLIINPGDMVLIRGDNGSGKTTMIKAIVGYIRREVEGEISWYSENKKLIINKSSLNKLQKSYWKHIDAIFQNPDISVPKYLKINEKNFAKNREHNYSIREILESLNLEGCYKKRFYQLSYGQKKRIKLLRILLRRPSIILLDEPTASLDIDNIKIFLESINQILSSNPKTTLFIVTHQDIFQKVLHNQVKTIEMKNQIKE